MEAKDTLMSEFMNGISKLPKWAQMLINAQDAEIIRLTGLLQQYYHKEIRDESA